MLKSSPVLTASANTSPTTFRYAPARSPHASPRNSVAKQNRRPPPAASFAAQDAMFSGSPSVADRSSATLAPGAVSQDAASSSSAAAAAVATNTAATEPAKPANTIEGAAAAQPQIAVAANGAPMQTDVSPPKRRGSPSTDDPSASTLETAKRIRPDEQPDKLLPQRYELCAVEDMVELIAYMVNELIATNDAIRTASGGLTRFHSR